MLHWDIPCLLKRGDGLYVPLQHFATLLLASHSLLHCHSLPHHIPHHITFFTALHSLQFICYYIFAAAHDDTCHVEKAV